MKLFQWARLALLLGCITWMGEKAMAEPSVEAVDAVLNQFHKAASDHDFAKYFGLMTEDAVFIGTDASERWDVKAFKAYVKPIFDKGKGWTYIKKERHISLAPGATVAWFDEILNNDKYGVCRGTGVLVKSGKDWKISQYHLTIPVPNELADKVTSLIKAPH